MKYCIMTYGDVTEYEPEDREYTVRLFQHELAFYIGPRQRFAVAAERYGVVVRT